MLQQYLRFTVLKPGNSGSFSHHDIQLQQYLPFIISAFFYILELVNIYCFKDGVKLNTLIMGTETHD